MSSDNTGEGGDDVLALHAIEGIELVSRLDTVLDEVESGTVFRVSATQIDEGWFVLGPCGVFSPVFAAHDEEYGWPVKIKASLVKTIDELLPTYRRHPIVWRYGAPVAMSINRREYDLLVEQA
jgi:hypothetical protein